MENEKLPKRKRTRLQCFDYSKNGAYFITICSYNKKCIFSRIVGQGLAPAAVKLSVLGKIASGKIKKLENRYATVKIDKYVIMPNHIHAIIIIEQTAGASPCPTLSDIICTFKSLTTKNYHGIEPNAKIWQTSFHDHIIRDERDYQKIWNYIDSNPYKWNEDCFLVKIKLNPHRFFGGDFAIYNSSIFSRLKTSEAKKSARLISRPSHIS